MKTISEFADTLIVVIISLFLALHMESMSVGLLLFVYGAVSIFLMDCHRYLLGIEPKSKVTAFFKSHIDVVALAYYATLLLSLSALSFIFTAMSVLLWVIFVLELYKRFWRAS